MRVLINDHESLNKLLLELMGLVRRSDFRWSFELLDLFCAQLAVHIRAENVCLFPAILNAPNNRFTEAGLEITALRETIEKLKHQHSMLTEELKKSASLMRELLDNVENGENGGLTDAMAKSLTAVGILLAEHQELEEREVCPAAKLVLDPAEFVRLEEAVEQETHKLPDDLDENRQSRRGQASA